MERGESGTLDFYNQGVLIGGGSKGRMVSWEGNDLRGGVWHVRERAEKGGYVSRK